MHTSTTLRLFVPLLLSPLTGCGPDVALDEWGALPTPVVLEVPRPSFARASVSDDLGFTPVAATVRTVTDPALKLVDSITKGKEPEVTPAGLEWRSSPGLAEAFLFRLVLENVGNRWADPERLWGPAKPAQSWRWRVEARPKMATDTAFRVVMEGTRETPEGDWEAAHGSGTFQVDWRASCEFLDRAACPVGDAGQSALSASFTLGEGPRTLTLELVRISPGETVTTTTVDGTIDATGAGTLRTSVRYDVPNPRPWSAVPYSRRLQWGADGAGRIEHTGFWTSSDGTWGTYSGLQCWGLDASITYSRVEGGPSGGEETGDATTCPAPVEPLP
ncbi:hypothetical protein [Archangium violaceum]|uniref:hypothetical protein n=1 Tax=Archangium violaceum TaxID=83451 RepID=UPI0036DC7162